MHRSSRQIRNLQRRRRGKADAVWSLGQSALGSRVFTRGSFRRTVPDVSRLTDVWRRSVMVGNAPPGFRWQNVSRSPSRCRPATRSRRPGGISLGDGSVIAGEADDGAESFIAFPAPERMATPRPHSPSSLSFPIVHGSPQRSGDRREQQLQPCSGRPERSRSCRTSRPSPTASLRPFLRRRGGSRHLRRLRLPFRGRVVATRRYGSAARRTPSPRCSRTGHASHGWQVGRDPAVSNTARRCRGGQEPERTDRGLDRAPSIGATTASTTTATARSTGRRRVSVDPGPAVQEATRSHDRRGPTPAVLSRCRARRLGVAFPRSAPRLCCVSVRGGGRPHDGPALRQDRRDRDDHAETAPNATSERGFSVPISDALSQALVRRGNRGSRRTRGSG
jgi:hypothetical protein